jgi:hypothetical protein
MTSQDRTLRGEVEEILSLVPGATAAEADALETLFAAAVGPPRTGELPGEAAAVAAFCAAQQRPAPTARRARILASLTTLLTVKTAATALAVTSVGGLAFAAGTGTLPKPLAPHHAEHTTVDTPTTVVPTPSAAALRNAAKAAAAVDRADAKAGKNRSASYAGLCAAFSAGAWDNARAAGSPAFARLVAAAPAGDVTDFCQALATEAALTDPGPATPGRQKAVGKSRAGSTPAAADDHVTSHGNADKTERPPASDRSGGPSSAHANNRGGKPAANR